MTDLPTILSQLEIVDAMIEDGETVTARTMLLGIMARIDTEIAEQATDDGPPIYSEEQREMLDDIDRQYYVVSDVQEEVRREATFFETAGFRHDQGLRAHYQFERQEYDILVDMYNDKFGTKIPHWEIFDGC
jgi:hypothetical protein